MKPRELFLFFVLLIVVAAWAVIGIRAIAYW